MNSLYTEIKSCTVCKDFLPYDPNPIFSFDQNSKIIIIGQAPGRIVHQTGIPWNDKSGDRLRDWMGITKKEFYDPSIFAIVPMGFCYPGTGKNGDLPPRKECAPLWHQQLIDNMPNLQLFLTVGSYATKYYIGYKKWKNLTNTVQNFHEFQPKYFPLPHPSGRNNLWLRKNPWFESEVIPHLRNTISKIL